MSSSKNSLLKANLFLANLLPCYFIAIDTHHDGLLFNSCRVAVLCKIVPQNKCGTHLTLNVFSLRLLTFITSGLISAICNSDPVSYKTFQRGGSTPRELLFNKFQLTGKRKFLSK